MRGSLAARESSRGELRIYLVPREGVIKQQTRCKRRKQKGGHTTSHSQSIWILDHVGQGKGN